MLLVAASALGWGLFLPIVRVRTLLVFERPISILDGVRLLWEDGEYVLAVLLGAFSVVLPAAKIATLLVLWAARRTGNAVGTRLVTVLEATQRWAMLDVFVVAFVVFALKTGALADAATAGALLPFIAAVALTALAARLLRA